MHYDVPYKTKQFFFVVIKLSIVIGAFYFIYTKLAENQNLELNEFVRFLNENRVFSFKNISFLIILSIFNWFFEILKWKNLVLTVQKISFKDALEQSLGGLTASLITPNRIGEYGAKAIYFTKGYRKRIVLLNLIGNMSQMTITTIFGITGFIVFVNRYQIDVNYYKITKFGVILLLLSLFTVLGVKQKRYKIKCFTTDKIFNFIKSLSSKTRFYVVLFSLIRYCIFSFQFYYLLTIFGVEVDYSKAMMVITSMYLLASIVPSITFFDVVIKGSVAVFLFNYVGVNELTILSITTLMWLLNFVIPSLFGSYFVLDFNLGKYIE